MKIVRLVVLLLAALAVAPAAPQQESAALERIKAEKKAWVALNMELAPADAESFWPVYEGYQKDLNQINTRVVRLIESYASHYRDRSLTEEGARKLYQESLSIDESYLKLRKTYAGRFAKVLNARQVARYLQLEDRINTQMRYELQANLPLIGDVKFTAPPPSK
jgi:hypothetical protein